VRVIAASASHTNPFRNANRCFIAASVEKVLVDVS